jgi:hypothetical protein
VPLAAGARSDIVGSAEAPIPGVGGSVPGTVYGTAYATSVPISTAPGGLPYEVGAAGPSAENIWEIGVAESYCQYPIFKMVGVLKSYQMLEHLVKFTIPKCNNL